MMLRPFHTSCCRVWVVFYFNYYFWRCGFSPLVPPIFKGLWNMVSPCILFVVLFLSLWLGLSDFMFLLFCWITCSFSALHLCPPFSLASSNASYFLYFGKFTCFLIFPIKMLPTCFSIFNTFTFSTYLNQTKPNQCSHVFLLHKITKSQTFPQCWKILHRLDIVNSSGNLEKKKVVTSRCPFLLLYLCWPFTPLFPHHK